MIIYVTPFTRKRHSKYLEQYYQLRKTVFCDTLNWVEPTNSELEKDALDEDYNVTLLCVDNITDQVVGGIRLVPTTGKTLLHDVWVDMIPDKDDFRSPNIWEATRFCTNERLTGDRNKHFVNRIFYTLIVATLEFAGENGITSIIAVCEKKFINMFGAFNADFEIISEKTDPNGCEICCTLWSTEPEIRKSIGWAIPFLEGASAPRL